MKKNLSVFEKEKMNKKAITKKKKKEEEQKKRVVDDNDDDEGDEVVDGHVDAGGEDDPRWRLLDLRVRHGDRFVKVSQVAERPQEVARYGVKLPLELSRHWNVKTLRDALHKALEHAGLPVKHSLFDWWLFSTAQDTLSALLAVGKLADFDMDQDDEEERAKAQDRVVPNLESGLKHLRAAFDSDLLRPVTEAQREAIEKEFEPELRQRIKLMATAIRKASHPSAPSEAEVALEAGEVVVGRVHMQIRDDYRAKLLTLYKLFGNAKGEGFETALAALLLRYDPFGGGSYQCSLPPIVFEALRFDFGVFMECFASPFNAHFPRYCSAFDDTDFAFGSLGSFFSFRPTEGSFESHPPPVPHLVEAMVQHMEDVLLMTKKPLSFVVILSAQGEESPLFALVKASRYCKHHLILQAHHHSFTVGKEHRHKEKKLLQLCVKPSSVLWLQNEGGNQRWAPTEERLMRLRRAFAGHDPNAPDTAVAAVAATVTAAHVTKAGSNWKQLQSQIKRSKPEPAAK